MRYINYLTESTVDIETFRNDVSQYLNEMKGQKLWRSTNKKINGIYKLKPRLNRTPKDTPLDVHEYFDEEFKKKFGWKARSQGVFTSSSPEAFDTFGKYTYVFYPCNGYKYIWSSEVTDMTEYLDRMELIYAPHQKWIENSLWYDKEYREKITKKMMNSYTDKNLTKSSWSSTEVMFYCPNGYYMVDGDFFREYYDDIYDGYTR